MKSLLAIRRYLSPLLILLLFLPLSRCDYGADKRKSDSSTTILQQQNSQQNLSEDYALAYKAFEVPRNLSELLDVVLVLLTFVVPPLLVLAAKILPEKTISVVLMFCFPAAAYFLWIAVWLPFLQPLVAGWLTNIVWAYLITVSFLHLGYLRFSSKH